jgi:hypothetical protein
VGRVDPYAQLHARVAWSFGALQGIFSVKNLLNKRGAFTREMFVDTPIEIRVPPRTVSLGLQYPF